VGGLLFFGATTPSPSFQATMQGYWTRFATTGDPNGGGAPEWPRYALASDSHLALTDPAPAAGANLQKAQCDFWATHAYASAP
jgi:para-nitrobenzyl esterase